ncbi:hypothetical protein IOD06_04480 [Psychrobacter sp. N25K4-3-2]|uniref:hypothetical protein n=1 Tax=Psychrobacter sp. N25K4-3-2 TaxID=2785026 RepID=UPI00188D713B|nr:hypothetical protein [Psychrobacter sp. N25K4-3-2]MBF4489141.1 hypothetical protein [Psychrobacter sp. N25K4-3-2]
MSTPNHLKKEEAGQSIIDQNDGRKRFGEVDSKLKCLSARVTRELPNSFKNFIV